MFMPLIIALAIGATSTGDDGIVIVNDQPSITITLSRYDLGKAEGVSRLKRRIAYAAKRVCDRSYRGISSLETVACVKRAIADGDAQLDRVIALNPGTAATATVAVNAPAN